ncbi:MAG: GNAT family N-acetyltransferase [Candidatus Hydrogenedentales bacterium]
MFETNRLRLRPSALNDVDTFHAIWTDPGVRRYLWDNQAIEREVAEAVIRDSVQTFAHTGIGQWLVTTAASGEVAGFFGLRAIEGTPADIELLYGFFPQFWGQGYAVEASRALIDYAFNTVRLPHLVVEMDEPNVASARVAEKLGARFIKRYSRNNLPTLRYVLNAPA